MIKLENIVKTYNINTNPVYALKKINLTLENGMTAIIGRSGSGKSSLLNILGALDHPTSGNLYYNDINLLSLDDDALADFRNNTIGYIFQSFYLEPSLKVIDNVSLPLLINGVNKKDRHDKAKELLDKLGMKDKYEQKTAELSGGEMQRVCIARALINSPSIILADEPTGNLDYENGQEVMKILKSIALSEKIVILVTHNLEDAQKYADKLIKLTDGQIEVKNG